jgi:hypothetical protein
LTAPLELGPRLTSGLGSQSPFDDEQDDAGCNGYRFNDAFGKATLALGQA